MLPDNLESGYSFDALANIENKLFLNENEQK